MSVKSRVVFVCVLASVTLSSICECAIYHNEFAVWIPNGKGIADSIADKHGFVNRGQIGSLKNYYLFEHPHVRKRSVEHSHEHKTKLQNEEEVKWVQQQHERVRVKRDFSSPSFPSFSSFFSPFSSGGSSGVSSSHHNHHRAIGPVGPYSPYSDPLWREQWYMNGGAKTGHDMNIQPAWKKGYTGKNVVVSILDDGIQPNHPDLAFNYDRDASTDINDNDDDPTPRDNGDNKHGTRCAGEVAAVAFNNYCGIGVAYNASIGGVRMLDGTVNDAVEARALGLNPDHIDIYSASWGPEDDGKTVDGPGPLARRAFIYGVTSGRKGKGSIFVWASGNGGRHTDSCNCDGYTNSIFTLSISSATQAGFKPWYLEECSSTLATTYSSGTPGHDKSVATVDMDGRLRPDHICTVEHTGTSASAPLAAGICALALEANPDLTWRDMQYLVVLSSRVEPLDKENGWIVNGVKRKVSHKFGYGLMDAEAMVNLAEKWTPVPPQHICKSQELAEDRVIESTFGQTLQVHMDVNGCANSLNEVRFLEHVQCKVSLRFFPRGNLRLLLTSPMGTTSTLLFERPRDVVSSNFDDWPFLSVHFWGERAEGRWTLQVVNAGNRHVNQPGVLKKWQLIFYGTNTNPIRLKQSYSSGVSGSGAYSGYSSQPSAPPASSFVFPGPQSGPSPSAVPYSVFHDYSSASSVYSGQGSEIDTAISDPNGSDVESDNLVGAGEDSSKRVLHDCDEQCDSQGCYGKEPHQCISCKIYRLDNTCVSRCPPRSFPNSGGRCWPCHETCETCAGPGQDSCLTCAPAHLHVTDLAVCLQQCPEGYYENFDQRTCVPCEANCASCQDRPDFCTSCDHHLVMHNHTCLASCPDHTYETDDYNCAPCHSSCDSCSGPGEDQCITCRPGHFALAGSKCPQECPEGWYADKKRRECLPCQPGCTSCNSGLCNSCSAGWKLNKKSRCVPENSNRCQAMEYFEVTHEICQSCHKSCEACGGPGSESCLSCVSPLVLSGGRCVGDCPKGSFLEQGRCVPCLHTCTACESRLNCTSCVPGLHLQNGECRSTCADGYYSDRGLCSKCYLSCATCLGPRRDQCVTCPRGWQLAAGECHPECPEGFFKSHFGCQKCHHYCRTCKGEGPLECTSCPPRYTLEGGLCMECLGGQYYDAATQLCRPCTDPCRTCSGPGFSSCTGCRDPLQLDPRTKQCVTCCSSLGEANCCMCDPQTGKCMSGSAGKRRIADEQSYPPAQSEGTVSFSSPLAVIAICSGLVITLGVLLLFVQACVRNNRRSKAYYGQLATCEVDSHMSLGRPNEKGSSLDYGEGTTLLHNEYCDYDDDAGDSDEEEINVSSKGPTIRT